MKTYSSPTRSLDRTQTGFTIFLIATGLALLIGSYAGVVSLDHIEKFWPVSIVAAGLAQLLASNDGQRT